METHFQTSFIPKKGIDTSGGGPVQSGQKLPIGIFFIISSALFGLSLAIAVGVFAYEKYLNTSIEAQASQIEDARAAIDEGQIKTISRLSDRIKSANSLLDTHLAISKIFTILEDSTVDSVRFTNFTYTYAGQDKINLSMKGEGKNFASIANQAEAFKTGSTTQVYFKNSIFSDVQKSDTGIINFNFSTSVDVKAILFGLHLNDAQMDVNGLLSNGKKDDGSTPKNTNAPAVAPAPTVPVGTSTNKVPTNAIKPKTTTAPAAPKNSTSSGAGAGAIVNLDQQP